MRLLPRLIIALLICLIAIPVLAIPVTPSWAQPVLPHAFYGSVTIDGTAAPIRAVVEARGTGVSTGIEGNPITVTETGKYGGPGGFDPKLVVQGDITDGTNLTFYVNNVTTQCYDVQAGGEWLDSYPFKSGDVTVLNLKVGEAPPIKPDISVSPAAKNFRNITADSSSSPQTFTVRNVGYADLVVGPIKITGKKADQFAIQNDNVTNKTIIPGGSATLQVVFTPTSTVAKSATLYIPSNDPDEVNVLVSLSGTGVTAGPGPAEYNLTVNVFGDISEWDISEQGNLLELLQVSSVDNKVTISLNKDASCRDKEDNRLKTITIIEQTDWPPVPEDYDIIGTAYEFQPAGAKFAPALSLTLSYVDNDVPQYLSEEDVYIAYYNTTAENWVRLTSQVDTENNIVTAPVSHFTTFAIMGGAAIPPTPANFTVTSLDCSSEQVEPGQEVLVTVNVNNSGGCEGSYTLNLTINGAVEQTKTVTLAPSASDTVTFTVIKEEPGSYTISVDGLTKEFIVAVSIVAAPPWLSRYWWTIVVGLAVIGLLLFLFRWWLPRKAVGS